MFKLLAKTVILFIFIILVCACEPAEIPTPHPTIPATPSTTSLPATPTYTTTPTPTLAIPLDGRGGGLIAFYSERDGNAEIYIMNADGSAETRLTQNQFLDTAPDISPDGSQVVFVSNRDGNEEIYRMSRDGSNIFRLTSAAAQDSYPFWSSDGTKIIFCSKRDDDLTYEVYIMNSDGSDQRRITNNTVSEEWAYLSPDMQKIVYAIGSFPEYSLYVMNANGSDPHQIFSTDKSAAIPKWSRDGKTIAYNLFAFTTGNIVGEIFLIDADGTSSRQITETGGNSISESPYWSPDGSQIVFQSNRTENFQIYVMNADGSNQQRLTNHTGNDYWPSWAEVDANRTALATSNNSLIAFSSDQDGDFDVWVMNADGSDQHNLTNNASMDISPAWSPDGSRIAFVSDRDGNDEIYIMNADGSDVQRLTETADAGESFPAWSPDGTEISFDSDRDGNWEIYLMASDGSNPRRLTNDPADDWITSWSPDGSQIVFESERDGNYEIYVMDSDGSNQHRLTTNQTHDGFPAWSPNGKQIAFMSRQDGNYEIYTMNVDGTNQRRLTNNTMEDSDPAWSPDGKWLAFVSNHDGNDEIYIMKSAGDDIHQLTDNGARNWSPTWQPSILENTSPDSWSGPYFGQEPPGMEPEIFAPGYISSPDFSEYSGSFSSDGDEYYFYRYAPTSESVLLFSKVVDGKWSTPEQLAVSSEYVAFEPYVTLDNQRLYFAWGYPVSAGQPQFPYFFVERTENGWSEPIYAGQGMFLSSSQDGQLYTTDMSSRNVDGKTYLAKITVIDGVFTDYERLLIETPWENPAHPCIALDGSYILYDVGSGNHLFVSFRKVDGTWGEPIDLTQHGFDPMAGGAYISPDGKYLFFSLNKDIWWVDIKVIENLRPSE